MIREAASTKFVNDGQQSRVTRVGISFPQGGSAQLSQRERHEQPGRCVGQVVLSLVAFVQKAQVLFSARQEQPSRLAPRVVIYARLRRP
jgi:hypothetical protein